VIAQAAWGAGQMVEVFLQAFPDRDRDGGLWGLALLARELRKLGHEVRLIAPQHVKPYVRPEQE